MKRKTANNKEKILKLKKKPKSGESSLNKAVRNVKEILEKKIKDDKVEEKKIEKSPKVENIIKIKGLKKSNKKPAEPSIPQTQTARGVIYIGHLPHGFYEEQMKKYFSQFGEVTNVRVSRSKKNGQSKGYGFIEFLEPEVAKIAAESMNNYLMCGRLIKTQYIPPEKQHTGYFIGRAWSVRKHPKLQKRIKNIKTTNKSVPNKNYKSFASKTVKNLSKLSQKLTAAGINLNIELGDVKI